MNTVIETKKATKADVQYNIYKVIPASQDPTKGGYYLERNGGMFHWTSDGRVERGMSIPEPKAYKTEFDGTTFGTPCFDWKEDGSGNGTGAAFGLNIFVENVSKSESNLVVGFLGAREFVQVIKCERLPDGFMAFDRAQAEDAIIEKFGTSV